ncbi:MAG TPA: ElyC/SanA/YdcF family protein [Patescibacteria group bacterium]|nr:ElyC/SanA/YdcF family protein [Patescibacteria group bacterium]
MKHFFKKLAIILVAGSALLVLFIAACNLWVIESAAGHIYSDLIAIPHNDVGIVLGTSNFTRAGTTNLHFKNRMEAAAELYNAGKVRHLLLSGANTSIYYNEPQRMQHVLLKLGIPEKAMTLDYAGLRTFDSMIRARKIFGLSKFTVVSQEFHNYRALFIARNSNIDAIAYNAEEAPIEQNFETELREYLARVNAILDVYLWNTQPRFLGKREHVVIDTSQTPMDSLPTIPDSLQKTDSIKKGF